MHVGRGLLVAALLGAALFWTSLPAREGDAGPRVRRVAHELARPAANAEAGRSARLRPSDAMKLVLLSCFKSQ